MNLTQEQLDLLNRLQPKFINVMGAWQVGDHVFCQYIEKLVGTIVEIEEYRNNTYIHTYWNDIGESRDILKIANKELFRIPKPIDWQNPERGCEGMLKRPYQLQRLKNGTIKLYTKTYSDGAIEAPDPFTALLKALAQQEGV